MFRREEELVADRLAAEKSGDVSGGLPKIRVTKAESEQTTNPGTQGERAGGLFRGTIGPNFRPEFQARTITGPKLLSANQKSTLKNRNKHTSQFRMV